MDRSQIATVLDWNADLWIPIFGARTKVPLVLFLRSSIIMVILYIYTVVVAITLLYATAMVPIAADRIAADPSLQEYAWTLPLADLSVSLLGSTWIVLVLCTCTSYVFAAAWTLRRWEREEATA